MRARAQRAHFSGKDAGLISSRKSNPMTGRPRAPRRNRCARHARRWLLPFALCILHLALCTLSPAQPPPSGGMNRLPSVDPAPVQMAQLPTMPFAPQQTVPAPTPTRPPLSSFRRIQVFPRSEGVGPSAESLTMPDGEKAAVISGGVNVVVQGLSGDKPPATLGPLGDVDIETDRVVIWGLDTGGGLAGATQSADTPLE